MKYKIGQNVICKPKDWHIPGLEFKARIEDIVSNKYLCIDQDDDVFAFDENEIELNTEN